MISVTTHISEILSAPEPIYVRAPRGRDLHCQGWIQEAALRMLLNNLDPEVAEKPLELIVYGGGGKAARNWKCLQAIVRALLNLKNDETLLVQSGKPVGMLPSHPDAPRVIIANSNLVPLWANWKTFWELEKQGLIMFGQMTAGSWIYIGTQGILQGTYETFSSLARQNGWGNLEGKFVLTAGLGEMGGAQPQAITFNGGVGLIVEINPWRIQRRLQLKQVDKATDNLDEALKLVKEALQKKEPLSV
ncbi:MAG: hypothetical protein QXI19_09385, partial [Candidatus Caldarchaeum sp.]